MRNNDLCRRLSALTMVLLLLSGVMTGCGGEEEIPQVTLRTMSVLGDDGTREIYTELLESYSSQYPHVYHMGTLAEASNAYKLNAVFEDTYTASRYPHAVCYYIDTGILELSEQFVSVEEIRERYPEFAVGVTDAALDSVRADDGKAYCVPFAGSWTAMAVNTALFERYSLSVPDSWQDLVVASGIFSARGITAIANSPDNSDALLELLCLSTDSMDALDAVLSGDPETVSDFHREAWLNIYNMYQELTGIHSFPAAVTTDEILAAIDQLNRVEEAKAALAAITVSESDVSSSDVPTDTTSFSDIPVQTIEVDAIDLFNTGEAAMLILDSDDLEKITLTDCTVVCFPSNTTDGTQRLVGGYDTGWFITRRAFKDKSVCDSVVAFVDSMTNGAASDGFASIGGLPAIVSDGDVRGLYSLADGADDFVQSRRTSVNGAMFSRLEHIASALSMKIISPEQAVELTFDSSLHLTDVIEQIPELPDEVVSGSDT